MHVLAIDNGTYSIKFISSFVERRKISHVELGEIIIPDYMADHPSLSQEEAVNSIIQDILDMVSRPDTKIIQQIDPRMLTTRFLNFPVKNKKKAELMLPYQLEEDIPYALNDIHYAYRLEAQKNQQSALIELVRNSVFEPYYNNLRDKNILPGILTTESSIVENFSNLNPVSGAVCYLDIGHSTSKAYFFYNSKLLMSQISYVGGSHINEMIAETYNIEIIEAIIYKHQNAFFLTSGQYTDVEPAQRDFASAMDKVFSNLINDFLRWKIALKVNYGFNLQHIFICGGTANIKNISNYLTEKTGVKVTPLETFDKVETEKVKIQPNLKSNFTLANMMTIGFKKKNRFINLLSGRFTQTSTSDVPLHSLAFIGIRVAALFVIFSVSLLVERFFIQKDILFVNSKISDVLKSSTLQLPGRIAREASRNSKAAMTELTKKSRDVRQEISTLQSAIEIKALSPLVLVNQIVTGFDGVTLVEFESDDSGEIKAVFTSESIDDLKNLKTQFEKSKLNDVEVGLNEVSLQLSINAIGN